MLLRQQQQVSSNTAVLCVLLGVVPNLRAFCAYSSPQRASILNFVYIAERLDREMGVIRGFGGDGNGRDNPRRRVVFNAG